MSLPYSYHTLAIQTYTCPYHTLLKKPKSVPGGGTRSESDGYVRPEMGGRKIDPYSDSKMTKEKTPLQ